MLGIEFFPAIIYFILLFFIPKSPRWLFFRGRTEQASIVLERLYGPEQAKKELEQFTISQQEASQKQRITASKIASLWFVLLIALILGILQQITGVNAIYFYATTIFEQSGVGTNAAFAQAVWVGIINVVFTLVAMSLIDRMGRKPLLLIGIAGIAVSMSLTSYGFMQATYSLDEEKISKIEGINQGALASVSGQVFDNDVDFKNAVRATLGEVEYSRFEGAILKEAAQMNPILILIGILGFVASFAISLGPVMWVMLSELFPNWVRGLAISVIGFINSATSWLVQFIFPWELNNLGNGVTYMIYGIFAVLGFIILSRILPETKGKTLEEIERELVR